MFPSSDYSNLARLSKPRDSSTQKNFPSTKRLCAQSSFGFRRRPFHGLPKAINYRFSSLQESVNGHGLLERDLEKGLDELAAMRMRLEKKESNGRDLPMFLNCNYKLVLAIYVVCG